MKVAGGGAGTGPVRGLLRVYGRFGRQIRPHRWALLGGVGAVVAEVVLRLAEPWALKVVFDGLLMPGNGTGSWAEAWVTAVGREAALGWIGVFVVGVTGLRALASYAGTVTFAQVGSRVMSKVRADLFRHLQCLSLSFHARARHGDLVQRVVSDVGLLQDALVTAMVPLATKSAMLVGMVVLMFFMNPQLALVGVSVLPLFWLRGKRLTRSIHEAARKQRHREGDMAAMAAESLGAVQAVQTLSMEGRFSESFTRRNDKVVREDVRGKRLAAELERSVDVFIALATALVLWNGTTLVWRGVLTGGELLVFLAYLKTAFRPMQDGAKYSGRLAKAAAAGERVLAVLEEEASVTSAPGAVVAPAFRGTIRFDTVTFRYPGVAGGVRGGVEGISFEVGAGEWVALVGASGSGKSTLLALVSRLYDPTSGAVTIDGLDLRELTVDSVRSQVGVVMQDTGLFAATVEENIRAGLEEATEAEVEAAARLANAHGFICSLDGGYRTVLGERGVSLSQGQRQRIAIARAALRRSPILLLDEPTNGLDRANAQAVFAGLRRLARGRTTLMATHDLSEAAQADRVLVIEEGRIVRSLRGVDLLAVGADGAVAAGPAGETEVDHAVQG